MELKRILGNTLWYGIIPKLPAILTLFLLPFITPYLTATDYGVLGLVTAYSAIAGSLATFGLHIHLANNFYEYKDTYKEKWNQLFTIMFFTSSFFAIILSIVLFYVIPEVRLESKLLVIIFASLSIVLIPNQMVANNFYLLINKPKEQVLRNLFSGLCAIFLIFYLVRVEKLGYVGWIIALGVGAIIAFLLFIRPLWFKEKIRPQKVILSKNELLSVFFISLPVIPHNLGHILLSSSDRIIMNFYSINTMDIGLYYNGYQVSEYTNMVLLGLCTAISPLFQKTFRGNEFDKVYSYYKVSMFLSIIIIFLSSLWMREFYVLFIHNNELQPAYEVARLNVLSYLPTVLYFFLSAKILIEKNTKYILWLIFLPAMTNILLNILLIPTYGYIAAVYTTILSYWIILLLPFIHPFFKASYRKMFGSLWSLGIFIFISIFIFIISYYSSESLVLKSVISIAIFVFSIFYFKLYKKVALKYGDF